MQRETIYKGATRPAMKFGVPLVPLVAMLGTTMLLILWGGLLLSWWVALAVLMVVIPMLVWMRMVTAKDDQRHRQVFLAMKLHLHVRNRAFWRARSYTPTLYRGVRDDWLV